MEGFAPPPPKSVASNIGPPVPPRLVGKGLDLNGGKGITPVVGKGGKGGKGKGKGKPVGKPLPKMKMHIPFIPGYAANPTLPVGMPPGMTAGMLPPQMTAGMLPPQMNAGMLPPQMNAGMLPPQMMAQMFPPVASTQMTAMHTPAESKTAGSLGPPMVPPQMLQMMQGAMHSMMKGMQIAAESKGNQELAKMMKGGKGFKVQEEFTKESVWVIPSHLEENFNPNIVVRVEDKRPDVGKAESWDSVGEAGWLKVKLTTGNIFYFNTKTERSTWDLPVDLGEDVDSDSEEFVVPEEEEGEESSEGENPLLKYNQFKELLLEIGVDGHPDYYQVLPQLVQDQRFKAIPGKERPALFQVMCKKIEEEKKEEIVRREKINLEEFKELLEEPFVVSVLRQKQGTTNLGLLVRAVERVALKDKRWKDTGKRKREELIRKAFEVMQKAEAEGKKEAKQKFQKQVNVVVEKYGERRFRDVIAEIVEDLTKEEVELIPVREQEQMYNDVCRRKSRETEIMSRKREMEDLEREMEYQRGKRAKVEVKEFLTAVLRERVKDPWNLTFPKAMEMCFENVKEFYEKFGEGNRAAEDVFEEYKREVTESRRDLLFLKLKTTFGEANPDALNLKEVRKQVKDVYIEKLPDSVLTSFLEEFAKTVEESIVEVFKKYLTTCKYFADQNLQKYLEDKSAFSKLQKKLHHSTKVFSQMEFISKKRDEMIKTQIQSIIRKRLEADQDCEKYDEMKMPQILSKDEIVKKIG